MPGGFNMAIDAARYPTRGPLYSPLSPATMLQHCPAHRLGRNPRKLPARPCLQGGIQGAMKGPALACCSPHPSWAGKRPAWAGAAPGSSHKNEIATQYGPGLARERCIPLAWPPHCRQASSALADARSSTWIASKAHPYLRLPASSDLVPEGLPGWPRGGALTLFLTNAHPIL